MRTCRRPQLLEGHLASSIGVRLLGEQTAFQFFSYLFNLQDWAEQDQLRRDEGVDRQIVKNPFAMRTNPSSLYNTNGDKRELFVRCVQRYVDDRKV